MPLRSPRNILLLIAVFHISVDTHGQIFDSLRFSSLDVIISPASIDFDKDGFNSLSGSFNFGNILSQPQGDSIEWLGSLNSSVFGFEFHVHSHDSLFHRHELVFSFQNQSIDLDWYRWELDSSRNDLIGRYEFFQLGAGYSYFIVNRRFLKLRTGLKLNVGFQISGSHHERSANEEIKYFSNRNLNSHVTIPLLFEVRLWRSTYFKIGWNGGYGIYNFDGYRTKGRLKGGAFGIRMGL